MSLIEALGKRATAPAARTKKAKAKPVAAAMTQDAAPSPTHGRATRAKAPAKKSTTVATAHASSLTPNIAGKRSSSRRAVVIDLATEEDNEVMKRDAVSPARTRAEHSSASRRLRAGKADATAAPGLSVSPLPSRLNEAKKRKGSSPTSRSAVSRSPAEVLKRRRSVEPPFSLK